MTPSRKVHLTKWERAAVERVLRAAGWAPTTDPGAPAPRHADVWWPERDMPRSVLDLRDVFPEPFTLTTPQEHG